MELRSGQLTISINLAVFSSGWRRDPRSFTASFESKLILLSINAATLSLLCGRKPTASS